MHLLRRFTLLATTTFILAAGGAAPALAQETCPSCEAATAARATTAAPRAEFVRTGDDRRARPLTGAHTERRGDVRGGARDDRRGEGRSGARGGARDDMRAALRELVRRARAGDERARAQLERLREKLAERGGPPPLERRRGGRADGGHSEGGRAEGGLGRGVDERRAERIGARLGERIGERIGERLAERARGAAPHGRRGEGFDGPRGPRSERLRGAGRGAGPQGPF